ncbi:type-2 ice-structuring protein-like isoform X2 [Micropterus salmoides]|uniref:type-2 ice-structuring protein-like isoform X2 n=1 Tax=Micropterus salmoides TaxID=27706 RepID=UPI0018EA9838|nr:type-2 ice-structuring protein-like isoform X2 [Micropterus salmoides]XP_038587376.1 type-2 ice-structuring protein-like isoform X2 [Micropterus salmoides]
MKTLTLSALLCAMMALTRAAALPDAEAGPGSEGSAVQESRVVKRSPCCPEGWTAFNSRCFLYVAKAMSWAVAETNCQFLGGNLASVHNIQEYQEIQRTIVKDSHNQGETWIGGSDAEQEGFWFWSDGTPFSFTQWCPGQPDNFQGHQNCLLMNFSDLKGWDDRGCEAQFPSVCVRNV